MITVEIVVERGRIRAFSLEGHADTAPRGQDIVCAAASAIAQTALLGLIEVAGGPGVDRIEPGSVIWSLREDEDLSDVGEGILRTMEMGLKALAGEHPEAVRIFRRGI